ncbi:MAG: adaptor protein MecA [Clostridia bacterium]|nr:adaptor protein MecA [Clostridia bacterium]
MKIEKLNDNKIRITLNLTDLEENHIDFHTFMSNSIESQKIFLDMLDKAEKEVGFVTDDYRVMIEALAMSDGNFVLTVTRFESEKTNTIYKKKKVNIKRKISEIDTKKAIYCFNTFDEYCSFCNFLNNNILKYMNDFADNMSLFEYNSKYYLVISNIHINTNLLKTFCSSITEFAHFVEGATLFENKLLEYGNLIMKDNAIDTCIKHFC